MRPRCQTDHGGRPFVLVAIGCSLAAALYFWSFALVSTDDALIYFAAARNAAAGHGPVLNPGDSQAATTSVLWTYLLAAVLAIVPTSDIALAARALATCFTFLSGAALVFATRRAVGYLALLAPVAVVSLRVVRDAVGLETSLAILAVSVILWCYLSARSWAATAAALAVGFFCRGDVLLFGVPIVVDALVTGRRGQSGRAGRARALVAALAFTAALGLGLSLQLLATGHVLPPTLHAKMIQGSIGPWSTYGSAAMSYLLCAAGWQWFGVPFVVWGLAALKRPAVILASAALLHLGAYSALSVADYPWYSWLLQLSVRLCLLVGVASALRYLVVGIAGARWVRPAAAAGVLASTLIAVAGLLELGPPRPFEHSASMKDLGFFRAYHAVARHVCADIGHPSGGAPPVVLAEEIGGIAYFCPPASGHARVEIRDVNGLASTGLTRENLNSWEYWVERYRPRYLVVRGDGGPTRRYAEGWLDTAGGRGTIYERALLLEEGDFLPVSVYRLASETPPFPRLAAGARLQLGDSGAEPYLWGGWSYPEEGCRWTDRARAYVLFGLESPGVTTLSMEMFCYREQRMTVVLNGSRIASFSCAERRKHERRFLLPRSALSSANVLVFELPDAVSPRQTGESADPRRLALGLCWMGLEG